MLGGRRGNISKVLRGQDAVTLRATNVTRTIAIGMGGCDMG
jgi:hypothetical protein